MTLAAIITTANPGQVLAGFVFVVCATIAVRAAIKAFGN